MLQSRVKAAISMLPAIMPLVAGTHPELTYTWLAAPELDELSVIKSGESVRYMLLKGSVRKKASITITGALDAQSMKKPKVLDFATETKLISEIARQAYQQLHR